MSTHKGDPMKRDRAYPTPELAIAARTSRQGECLIWTGSTSRGGYGQINIGGRPRRVHRYVWEKANGPIPEGMFIDHICHERACVELSHLRLATRSQNNAYRVGSRRDRLEPLPRNVERNGRGYAVRIASGGKRRYYGTFPTVEEAAAVADRERRRLFGEFAGGSAPHPEVICRSSAA